MVMAGDDMALLRSAREFGLRGIMEPKTLPRNLFVTFAKRLMLQLKPFSRQK